MARTLPISEARRRLIGLADDLGRNPEAGAVAVTRRGERVLAVMSWDLYESLAETIEILGDEKLMAMLRRSLADLRARRTRPWSVAKRKLEL
jgi:antitoxin YefM